MKVQENIRGELQTERKKKYEKTTVSARIMKKPRTAGNLRQRIEGGYVYVRALRGDGRNNGAR